MLNVDVCPTKLFPTAQATTQALDLQKDLFPVFVHKWSKEVRKYSRDDLYLPDFLNIRGRNPDWGLPIVGIGGTRSPLAETFRLVSQVVRILAKEKIIIVSGGVPGVDLAAHLAAVSVPNGVTLAVLANPVDKGLGGHEWNNSLVESAILKAGCFLSEYELCVPVLGEVFLERLLQRDRIISGLCDIFVSFECRQDSATIDTSRRAIIQGKKVFGISPMKKSDRRGIEQLSKDPYFKDVTILAERDLTPEVIAGTIAAAAFEKIKLRI